MRFFAWLSGWAAAISMVAVMDNDAIWAVAWFSFACLNLLASFAAD